MARIDWIERRLNNWARWRLTRGGGVLGVAAINWQQAATGVRDPYSAEAPIPVLEMEARDTDDAIATLPPEQQRVLVSEYCDTRGLRERLRRLGCGQTSYYERLYSAHRALAHHFEAKDQAARHERARVEALIASTSAARQTGKIVR